MTSDNKQITLFLLIVLSILLPSCAWMFGSDIHKHVVLQVPPQTRITDVFTGEVLPLDTIELRRGLATAVTIRNGKRFALRLEVDSTVAYATTSLERNWNSALNYFNFGIGFAVDQILETSYKVKPDTLKNISFEKMSVDRRNGIEDSLRSTARYPEMYSLINKRTDDLGSVWASMILADFSSDSRGGGCVGAGFVFNQWLMPFYEFSALSIVEYADRAGERVELTSMSYMHSLGILVRETRYGFFGSGSIGIDNHFSISAGLSGQWGRIEYRYLHMNPESSAFPGTTVALGLHCIGYTFNVML